MKLKKILLAISILIGGLGIFNFVHSTNKVYANVKVEKPDLKREIESFTAIGDQIMVKSIEKIVDFNKTQQIALFISQEDKLGYVILKDNKILTVAYGDNKYGYDQYKNYFIVYGEKPKLEYKKLNLLIQAKNNEDMNKSVNLGEGRYYLEIQKLPEGMKESRVYTDNYKFN